MNGGLPEAWRLAFDRLVQQEGAQEPTCDEFGCWTATIDWSTTSAGRVLALLPGEYKRVAEHYEELFDQNGEGVDYESESAMYVCDAERAILSYVDHWQAGLSATVAVYPNDEQYREGVRRYREADDSADVDFEQGLPERDGDG